MTATILERFQSTHPTRGATLHSFSLRRICRDFNPRTPHGVRRDVKNALLENIEFQSTHPTRGATIKRRLGRCSGVDFNPRTPHGVRPCRSIPSRQIKPISIHAPHTGCDPAYRHKGPSRGGFQSTHPTRGATVF